MLFRTDFFSANNRTKKKVFVLIVIFITSITSCRQVKEAQMLAKCDFRIAAVESVKIAGIPVAGINSLSDLNIVDNAKLAAKVLEGILPLTFTVKLEIKNPNSKPAALNRLDWILLIDDAELLTGTTAQRFEVPAGGKNTVPLFFEMDLVKIFAGRTGKALLETAISYAGISSKTTRVTMKLKPTIMVGKKAIKYPGYIKVTKDFSELTK